MSRRLLMLVLSLSCLTIPAFAQDAPAPEDPATEFSPADRLVILWTSADKETAEKMIFIYAFNAMKYEWWRDIELIVWGPSSFLLSQDSDLQERVLEMQEIGVRFTACKWCADEYGVSDDLAELGIDVKYMGKALTDYVQDGRHLMTF